MLGRRLVLGRAAVAVAVAVVVPAIRWHPRGRQRRHATDNPGQVHLLPRGEHVLELELELELELVLVLVLVLKLELVLELELELVLVSVLGIARHGR